MIPKERHEREHQRKNDRRKMKTNFDGIFIRWVMPFIFTLWIIALLLEYVW